MGRKRPGAKTFLETSEAMRTTWEHAKSRNKSEMITHGQTALNVLLDVLIRIPLLRSYWRRIKRTFQMCREQIKSFHS